MKKYLFILMVACLLVACEETQFLDIDSLSSQEFNELLKTGDGLDRLIQASQGKEVDYQKIEKLLSTTSTINLINTLYVYIDNQWESTRWLGGGTYIYTASPNASAIRTYFTPTFQEGYVYRDYPIDETLVAFILNSTYKDGGSIIAKLNDTTYVLEGIMSDGRKMRQLAILKDNRDWMLETYSTAFDDLQD